MVPWTWVAPASTAARALATPRPKSLWVWMPSGAVSLPRRRAVIARDFAGQAAAVGVAQHDAVGARLLRRLPGGQGVFGFVLVAVEGVLGVVDDDLAVVLEVPDGVADHGEVLVGRGAQDFLDVQQPGLAEDGDDGRLGLEQQPHLVVALDRRRLCGGSSRRRRAGRA